MTCCSNYDLSCMDYFTFDGVSSLDYGLIVVGERDFSGAGRDVEMVRILGKDGLIPKRSKGYNNIQRTFECNLIVEDWRELHNKMRDIRNWLTDVEGFRDFVLSYDDESIYKVMINDEIKAVMISEQIARVDITFETKPYHYFYDSFDFIREDKPFTLVNQRKVWSYPYILIEGSGKVDLHINNNTYAFTIKNGWIEIDSETMSVYRNNQGIIINEASNYTTRWFPNLKEGDNNISWTGNVSLIEIVPRWRSR
ncbi:hypothetical protein PDN54_08230 [Bacillus cereus group sp. Bc252]|uniref:phage tail domain-containing protein n=1 Tax=Bacillus TaxID=1386 RepID=UPI0021D1C2B3|nr:MULTISPECIES: phage tail domain-containing protein [Bacillus cereus group]MCU5206739.1 hypothetical protein [Bacillus paranthracis]MDA2160281.1 hypothetical protein [Bacillus cereus group sp. Bc252]HDR7786456.1 hypothetical protein [Bacillus paranthracis]